MSSSDLKSCVALLHDLPAVTLTVELDQLLSFLVIPQLIKKRNRVFSLYLVWIYHHQHVTPPARGVVLMMTATSCYRQTINVVKSSLSWLAFHQSSAEYADVSPLYLTVAQQDHRL